MANRPGELWRITGATFTALVQFTNRGHVWWAAPAVKQLERRSREQVLEYCSSRGWKVAREVREEVGNYFVGWEEVMPHKPE